MSELHVVDHGSGITSIRLELPFVSPAWVYAYVIEGDTGLALLDCGVDDAQSWDALVRGLDVVGYAASDLDTLVGSHMHPDHIGMANRVLAASDGVFVMHHATTDWAPYYNDWSIFRTAMARLARQRGATPDQATAIGRDDARPDWVPEAPEVTRPVGDGDKIDLGGRVLEVIHTPGHDRTHICLVDSVTGHLFSGDHVLPRITPHIGSDPDLDALGEYLASLERIVVLDPPLTYPAHVATPLERGGLRAHQIALHHERRLESILDLMRDGPISAWAIMEGIFRPHLSVFEQRLAFSETLSHLEHLRVRGDIELVTHDGRSDYRRCR